MRSHYVCWSRYGAPDELGISTEQRGHPAEAESPVEYGERRWRFTKKDIGLKSEPLCLDEGTDYQPVGQVS